MPKTEEDFPRGGIIKKGKKRKEPSGTSNGEIKDLFQTNDEKEQPSKKKSKVTRDKKQVQTPKSKTPTSNQIGSNVTNVEMINARSLCPGMLILGCIKEIHDYELIVSLSNGLTGAVQITNISDAYTSLLQKLTEGEGSEASELSSLYELFQVGSVVRCKVKEVVPAKKGRKIIKLSINPKDVNQALTGGSLKHGMTLSGNISSREDHGYVIDLGLQSVTAFLKNKAAEKFLENAEGDSLKIGQYVDCMIQSSDSLDLMMGEKRSVNVIIEPRKVYRSEIQESMGVTMNTLLPGMIFQASPIKVLQDGLVVKFLTYFGRIHKTHLQENMHSYEIKKPVRAVVLYIHPTTKVVGMSLHTHLVTPDLVPRKRFGDLTVGNIIEEAKIVKIDKKRAVYLELNERANGICYISNLSDKECKEIGKEYKRGTTHKCRVLDFDYVDNIAIVTMKESVLNQKFMSYADVEPGEVLQAEVKGIHQRGISVKITNHIKGFIPTMHLSDVPLKHPEKKFEMGGTVKCKVLTVDAENSKVILTCKKSLVTTKLPTLTSLSQVKASLTVEGVVVKIAENGLLVAFYNNIKGWVPRREISTERIEVLEKVFYVGQVVKCQIKSYNLDEGKITLSLKFTGKTPFGKKEVQVPSDFEVGKLIDGKVLKKNNTGFDIQLFSDDSTAFLPKLHLSDHTSNCEILFEVYKEGEVLKDLMYFGISNVVTLSMKPSLINASKNGTLVKEFDDLKAGDMVSGALKKVMDYGVFVEVAAGIMGLAPNKLMCDRRMESPSQLFKMGQSLEAKVTEVDSEKKRFLLSLKMADCYQNNTSIGIHLLEQYLSENKTIINSVSKLKGQKGQLAKLKVGSIVKAKITDTTDIGALCVLPKGIKGVITEENMTGTVVKAEDEVEAVVLFVDIKDNCVELSLNKELIKNISHFQDNKFTQAKELQIIKSEVHLIKDDFVLVSLKGHLSGRLAYIPAKRHLNDVLEKHQYVIGQVNPVVLKRVEEDFILGCLKIHDERSPEDQEDAEESANSKSHNLKPGMITGAVIKTVHQHQLNITVGGIFGRVHISEVVDQIENGANPYKGLKADMRVKVKVIGFREGKTHNYLPITHRNIGKALAECTLKPSKLKSKKFTEADDITAKKYKVGDKVIGYVVSYHNSCLWMEISPTMKGKAYLLNLSDNLTVLEHPTKSFHVGEAFNATILSMGDNNNCELTLRGTPSVVKAGAVLNGVIVSRNEHNGLVVQLSGGYMGRVALTDLEDSYTDNAMEKYKDKKFVQCCVVKCDNKHKDKCVLSLRPSRLSKGKKQIKDKDIRAITDLKVGMKLRGIVSNSGSKGVFVQLGENISGRVDCSDISEYFIKDIEEVIKVGTVVTSKIKKIQKSDNKIDLSLLKKDTGVALDIPKEYLLDRRSGQTNKQNVEEKTSKKKRKSDENVPERQIKKAKTVSDSEDEDSGVEEDGRDEKQNKKKSESGPVARLSLNAGFSWDTDFSVPEPSGENESESDSEEEEEEKKEIKVKKTKHERKEDLKREEKRLFEQEKLLLNADRKPQTAEDFDRLVLQSPDSSIVWLRYMAFHLETTEIEKARVVAERALKTISFREEQEKLNIWVAYMNLENMYGTHESLMAIFERAVKANEPVKVYYQLINIYVRSNKIEAAEGLYSQMVRRFSLNKEVWVKFGIFYFDQSKPESARKLMHRSFKSLDKKDHVEVISKFSQMEFKQGEPERGKTMFENLLGNYPKRTDLWSIYLDMVIKLGDIEVTRQLFERVIHLSFSAKKMKFMFKKYLDFEEKYGDEDSVLVVKKKALEYVESKASTAS